MEKVFSLEYHARQRLRTAFTLIDGVSLLQTVAVIGLGYVGLPLAVEFGKRFRTIGFDISTKRVDQCARHFDPNGEVTSADFLAATKLQVTNDERELVQADCIIIAVPTPVDAAHQPDFSALLGASRSAACHMKRGAVIIYESTVYPGATEEICIPVLEQHSGMKWKEGFNVGYSPERINPGDKNHTLTNIIKVVAGDNQETLEKVAQLYGAVVKAGIHRASSIKVAEAAKVIENTQRDLNIALMNELSIIFNKLGIDTLEVLEAAGTKWNFLPFRPGLVGGHCIGVDPYYLTHKAEMLGYHPEVILAGRRINDAMGQFVAEQTVKHMVRSGLQISGSRVSVLGVTFKENCPDLRNTKVIDIVRELERFGVRVDVHDPVAPPAEAKREYAIELLPWDALPKAQALIVAVTHDQFLARPVSDYVEKLQAGGCFMDVKSKFDCDELRRHGLSVWRL